jgi:hypothetical protein
MSADHRAVRKETRRIRGERSAAARPGKGRVWIWSRRLHFYLGLYFLLFVWLFSISGLALNHHWAFADFWPSRREATAERTIARPAMAGDLATAQALMRQLGIEGEVNDTKREPGADRFGFQVIRPRRTVNVEADFGTGLATVKEIRVNAWGVMSALHHFTGVSMTDETRTRDWWLTRIWSLAMDAVALGLIVLVASGVYLWYHLKAKRALGLLSLGLGLATSAFFLFGLGRMF